MQTFNRGAGSCLLIRAPSGDSVAVKVRDIDPNRVFVVAFSPDENSFAIWLREGEGERWGNVPSPLRMWPGWTLRIQVGGREVQVKLAGINLSPDSACLEVQAEPDIQVLRANSKGVYRPLDSSGRREERR